MSSTKAGFDEGKFILFGDSITQFANENFNAGHPNTHFFFQSSLQKDYVRKLDIINRGFSGYNSNHARVILPHILESDPNIKLMTVFFGTNDAVQTIQYVPLDKYTENVSSMIDEIKKKNIKPILIGPGLHQSFSFVAEKLNLTEVPEDNGNNITNKEYSELAKMVAEKHGIPFIDLWQGLRIAGGWSEDQLLKQDTDLGEFLLDNVHLNCNGYKVLYDLLMDSIRKNYPELSPEEMDFRCQYWRSIDPNNIEGTIFQSYHTPP